MKKSKSLSLDEKIINDRKIRKLKDETAYSKKKNKYFVERIERLEKELNALNEIRKETKSIVIPKKKGKKSTATAIWLASDWHVGEKVTKGQVNGVNYYNPKVAQKRAEAFFRNGLKLTKMSDKEVPIDKIILALLGDLITGHLHLDSVENNYLPPVKEAIFAKTLIISGIEYILKNSQYDLLVPCISGNHARSTKQVHFGSENGHSLEYFIYTSLATHFRNEPRVEIILPEGSQIYIKVYGRLLRFIHGHDVRYNGGVGGLTIPLNKAISQWDKMKPCYITFLGHFHQRVDGGNFLVNGSLIGYNAYALSIKASAERPQQSFLLLDSKRGRTITAPILVA